MSVLESNRSVPLGAVTTLRVVAVVERLVDNYLAWQRARQTARVLTGLSDKQLADIGLHRGDILEVSDQLARR